MQGDGRRWRLPSGALLAVVFGAMGFQVGAWALSLPAVSRELGMGARQLGVMLALMALAGVAATLATGRIAERFTPRCVLAVAAAGGGVGFLVLPLLDSSVAFTLGAMVTGAGLGMFDVAANAAGSREEARRGAPMLTSLHSVFSLAAAAAALVAYLLNGAAGYAPAFAAAGIGCLVGAGAALLLPSGPGQPGAASAADSQPDAELQRLATAAAVLAFVIVCGAFTVDATLEGFSALFIDQMPGQGAAQSAFGLAALYLASAAGRAVSTPVVTALGEWRTLLAGLGIVAAGLVLLVWVQAPWASATGMLAVGVGMAPTVPVGYSLMGRSRAEGVERAIARLTAAGYGSFVVAPLVIGWVGGESLVDAFRLLPALLAVMVVVTAWFGRRHRALVRASLAGT